MAGELPSHINYSTKLSYLAMRKYLEFSNLSSSALGLSPVPEQTTIMRSSFDWAEVQHSENTVPSGTA